MYMSHVIKTRQKPRQYSSRNQYVGEGVMMPHLSPLFADGQSVRRLRSAHDIGLSYTRAIYDKKP